MSDKFYGKYRGTVINNVDPDGIGKILVQVSDAIGQSISSWARPCVPIAGQNMGVHMIPAVNSGVWIEFEQGDISRPIWVGGYWNSRSELPSLSDPPNIPVNPNIVIQSLLGNTFVISDTPGPTGGLVLRSITGASIIVNDTGIYISNGKNASIELIGPTVSINGQALVVT